jgi:glycosyltransferase involved in cell wall biosynthesis
VNIGPVPPASLPEAYRSADALLLPTLLESFTRTYAEAMHFELPILTSNRDFARCICQDAALYFDPLDANSVARAMFRMMEDAALRRRLTQNGKRRRGQIPTWDEIATRFVSVLEGAALGCCEESVPSNLEESFATDVID